MVFYVSRFDVNFFLLLFSPMYQDDIKFSKVQVAKWPTFGKGADLVNILFMLCLFTI